MTALATAPATLYAVGDLVEILPEPAPFYRVTASGHPDDRRALTSAHRHGVRPGAVFRVVVEGDSVGDLRVEPHTIAEDAEGTPLYLAPECLTLWTPPADEEPEPEPEPVVEEPAEAERVARLYVPATLLAGVEPLTLSTLPAVGDRVVVLDRNGHPATERGDVALFLGSLSSGLARLDLLAPDGTVRTDPAYSVEIYPQRLALVPLVDAGEPEAPAEGADLSTPQEAAEGAPVESLRDLLDAALVDLAAARAATVEAEAAGEAEAARLREAASNAEARTTTARERHREDVRAIGSALLATADRSDWCGEYDREVEEVADAIHEGDTLRDVASRYRDWTVEVPVVVMVAVNVRARSEEDARSEAQDDWEDAAEGYSVRDHGSRDWSRTPEVEAA